MRGSRELTAFSVNRLASDRVAPCATMRRYATRRRHLGARGAPRRGLRRPRRRPPIRRRRSHARARSTTSGSSKAAIAAAEEGRLSPEHADSADLIAARAYLERFRESASADDLTNARDRLRRLDPQRLSTRERTEFVVGLGDTLFFDGSAGAAAEIFESVLAQLRDLARGAGARARLVGERARSRRPSAIGVRAAGGLREDSRAHARGARRASRQRRRRVLAGRGRRADRATGRPRGTRRRPAGCARRSAPTAANRCASISIG